ncbi:hypothetical protein FQN52_008790 [Onygenales sp. PD_12]|nr:hypothetical protein FQN52_008790 [Onygenales sp. PD_12]
MAKPTTNTFLQFQRTMIRPLVPRPPCYQQTRLSISHPQRRIATRVEPSRARYEFVEEVERLDYYIPGGYHPVMIGDEFCSGRYVIAHKLGFGRSATTWLAEDRRQSQLVALKISTAESAERTREMHILSRLARAESRLPGKAVVQKLLDSFLFSGPNGTHRCLVTDAARFVHSQGIVHGDLHLANILLRLPLDMQEMTLEQLRARTSEPVKERVVREGGDPLDPGVPSEVVVPVWLGLGSNEISLADSPIMIAHFGEAFDPQVTQQFTAHTPLLLAPPESRFAEPGESDEPLSFPGDIWTLACTIWDVFGSRPPFEAFPVTLDEVKIEQVEMLGKLPDRWWSKWDERSNWFDEDGHKNVKSDLHQWYGNSAMDWAQQFTEYIQRPQERRKFDTFSAEEENAFCDMMRSMLVLEPSKRATIEEVMGCQWMRGWGLPAVQRMEETIRESS